MKTRDAVLLAIITTLALCQMEGARGHDDKHMSDWIGNGNHRNPITGEHCCGLNDCLRVPADDVEFDASQGQRGVWIIRPTSEKIPATETLPSEDGHYWRCHMPNGKRRCFFVPPGVS